MSNPPAAARELFGPKLPQAQAYAALLAGPGVERGLIGPAEAGRIWERHLINSGLIVELLPTDFAPGATRAGTPRVADGSSAATEAGASVFAGCGFAGSGSGAAGSRPGESEDGGSAGGGPGSGWLIDLGSGAGLPGVVLAILRPDLRVTLMDPMARRTAFMAECVAELGLEHVEICRGRAEDMAGDIMADVVTSRAVARLGRLAEWSAGICRPGGLVLAIKGTSAAAELEEAEPALRRLGVTDAEVVRVGQDLAARGLIEHPTTVVRFSTGVKVKAERKRSRH